MTNLEAPIEALRNGQPIAINGALFDMDGTLVDSIPAVEAAWSLWSAELEIPTPTQAMHGKTARAVVVSSPLAVTEHARAEQRLAEIEARPGQQLLSMPGARALLESLPLTHWGVVTSALRTVAIARLEATDLPEGRFLVTGNDVSRGKPDPEPFLQGRQHLDRSNTEGVVVAFEDTVAGSTSAAGAGCLVIAVLGTDPRELLESCAHIVLDSLESVRIEGSSTDLSIRIV